MVCLLPNKSTLFIFPQNLSSDGFFVYAAGENNIVGLIHPTIDSGDTPAVYMTGENVVDNIIDDILQ